MITGMAAVASMDFSLFNTSVPSMSGSMISRRTRSGLCAFAASMASGPSLASSTLNPAFLRLYSRSVNMSGSSSTTSILAWLAFRKYELPYLFLYVVPYPLHHLPGPAQRVVYLPVYLPALVRRRAYLVGRGAAQSHDNVGPLDHLDRQLRRALRGDVYACLFHRVDGAPVHVTRSSGAGAFDLHLACPVLPGKALSHLAAASVPYADEEYLCRHYFSLKINFP